MRKMQSDDSSSSGLTGGDDFTMSLSDGIGLLRQLEGAYNNETDTYEDDDEEPKNKYSEDQRRMFGFVLLGVVLLIVVCLLYRLYVCCSRMRERRMLMQQSIRAEDVLGDMDMIGQESEDEGDDDGEDLI
mmetsp:Transcript_28824/g.40430  ORF Transcript_28824/g.40430 Transcript_28824/m.40430 type:complete len:130 (+) Transcript_28824:348-737(+)